MRYSSGDGDWSIESAANDHDYEDELDEFEAWIEAYEDMPEIGVEICEYDNCE